MNLIQTDKWYSPEEICELFNIKNDSNYCKTIKKRLDKIGLRYLYKTKRVKFMEAPTNEVKLLLVIKNINVVDEQDFITFYYCLLTSDEFNALTWKEKTNYLKNKYNCQNVDNKKLMRWKKKLKDTGLLNPNDEIIKAITNYIEGETKTIKQLEYEQMDICADYEIGLITKEEMMDMLEKNILSIYKKKKKNK